MKYKIEEVPNRDRIIIHLSKKVTEEHIVCFDAPIYVDEKYEGGISGTKRTEDLRYLAGALFQIEGITSITIQPYQLSIGKGMCFTWDDLLPEILRTINVMLADKEDMEELPKIAMSDAEAKRIQRQFERETKDFDWDFPGMDDDDNDRW